MAEDAPDIERRLTEIQSQINRLNLSFHLWRERQDRLLPAEHRLSQLTEQCSQIVEQWKVMGERQEQAVGHLEQRLKEWDARPLPSSPAVNGRELRADSSEGIRASRLWWLALAVVGVVVAGLLGTRFQRQIDARANAAQTKAAAATANQAIMAAREDAARQVADAREGARKARATSDVLAAPDLARFSLGGRSADRQPIAAQGLWSRSRGFIFSGSRLPPPPPDSTYQIWLLTDTHAVSAGTFVPDPEGGFTVARVPAPGVLLLTGMAVTIEPAGGSDRPTGMTVLSVN